MIRSSSQRPLAARIQGPASGGMIGLMLLLAAPAFPADGPARDSISVHKRSRVEKGGAFSVREAVEHWDPQATAVIVCDMWDAHPCLNAVRRAEEMAPRMNQ